MTYGEAAQELERMKEHTPQVLTEAHRALDMAITTLWMKETALSAPITQSERMIFDWAARGCTGEIV